MYSMRIWVYSLSKIYWHRFLKNGCEHIPRVLITWNCFGIGSNLFILTLNEFMAWAFKGNPAWFINYIQSLENNLFGKLKKIFLLYVQPGKYNAILRTLCIILSLPRVYFSLWGNKQRKLFWQLYLRVVTLLYGIIVCFTKNTHTKFYLLFSCLKELFPKLRFKHH